MDRLINFFLFVDQNQIGIYALCAAGVLVVWFWRLRPARRDLARAQYELERELALNRRARAIDQLGVLILIILAVVAISRVVAPYLRANPVSTTRFSMIDMRERFVTQVPNTSAHAVDATPDAQAILADTGDAMYPEGGGSAATPIPTLRGSPTDIFSGEVDATHTPTATPPGTLMPAADIPPVIGCNDPGAVIAMPVNGLVLYENVVVKGSANTAGFSSYRFELKGPETNDQWAVLRTYTAPVDNGVLGQFDGSAFEPGVYQFRLAVMDTEDNTIASCTISVRVAALPATPTPVHYN
ncbi:MAG: hypothetical protein JXB47_20665 [Anaerolineae bacterium]|nr:hypothetical protein [Anaerolineae bacterium]